LNWPILPPPRNCSNPKGCGHPSPSLPKPRSRAGTRQDSGRRCPLWRYIT
jgi:hypothetical protein